MSTDVTPWLAYPLSFSAGVNSTALAIVLIDNGWREPLLFTDPGGEWPETYAYMDYFTERVLAPAGLGITRVGPEYRREALRGLDLPGLCANQHIAPSVRHRWCTTDFKRIPLRRYADAHGLPRQRLIGIAADEAHRSQAELRPLVDLDVDRAACLRIIQARGLDPPPHSGCWFCPQQPLKQWFRLWILHNDLYTKLAAQERELAPIRGTPTTWRFRRRSLTLIGEQFATDRGFIPTRHSKNDDNPAEVLGCGFGECFPTDAPTRGYTVRRTPRPE